MNNVALAKEARLISYNRKYTINDNEIFLPEIDYSDVCVYSPEIGEQLINENIDLGGNMCKITITTEDTYEAAGRYNDCVSMNFANAHVPGGGFLLGATAQEESLCRCSTLYMSISGKKAAEMYRYNNTHISKVESDYMLYSDVCVFRKSDGTLLESPFLTSVISTPAPNRIGAAMFASDEEVAIAMKRRIKIMSVIAYKNKRKNLVLGAWGCGAFHNKPSDVAGYFKQVLVTEGYGKLFDEVCFAVYGSENGKNITAFRECFS